MKPSIISKLNHVLERYEEVGALLSNAGIINDQIRFRALSQEYAEIEPIAQAFKAYQQRETDILTTIEMLEEDDAEMHALAQEELQTLQAQQTQAEQTLQHLLLPKDPNDTRNVFLEIRAGTGGNEAALFAGDLFRMYARFAEKQRWQLDIISEHEGEQGGFKEIIARISGKNVYSKLKFESGAHRVQRVPETESQGRIHTSACTVAILPEVEEVEAININPNDLRVDTYRASGAGGQHVNKTDSAVRLTHLPTGIVVECQDERSQHKNKARAMSLLQAKLLSTEQEKQRQETAATRKNLVGSGDRSDRIRTYNFPQGRVTDHRINLTLYKLDEVIEGNLDPIIEPLQREHQVNLLQQQL